MMNRLPCGIGMGSESNQSVGTYIPILDNPLWGLGQHVRPIRSLQNQEVGAPMPADAGNGLSFLPEGIRGSFDLTLLLHMLSL